MTAPMKPDLQGINWFSQGSLISIPHIPEHWMPQEMDYEDQWNAVEWDVRRQIQSKLIFKVRAKLHIWIKREEL